jgi:hypothetical protein
MNGEKTKPEVWGIALFLTAFFALLCSTQIEG